jgi:hypothetical protein
MLQEAQHHPLMLWSLLCMEIKSGHLSYIWVNFYFILFFNLVGAMAPFGLNVALSLCIYMYIR